MIRLAVLILCAIPSVATAQSTPRSGYEFLSDGTKQLQDDDFLNPGFFIMPRGEALWDAEGPNGESCAGCHGAAQEAMRGVATRYPQVDDDLGLINLEQRINDERTRRMAAAPFEYESEDLLALTTYVATQSRGMDMAVETTGPARPYWERGRDFYETRRGQLNLACTHCHVDHVGDKLRGDVISEGQVNGFPIFRLIWNEMGSRHRMFAWCNDAVRAEPYALGSQEYLELELYVASRGTGLQIETPAVRR